MAASHIASDVVIRTSEPRHKEQVGKVVEKLVANGDIYLGSYGGWYDEGQEEFVTETEAKTNEYKSAISGRPLVRYKEPSYFFRLSKYVPQVLSHIESHPEFIRPESRRNEVVSKLKAGVEDLSGTGGAPGGAGTGGVVPGEGTQANGLVGQWTRALFVQTPDGDIHESREAGGPFLCSVHAAEELPAEEAGQLDDDVD